MRIDNSIQKNWNTELKVIFTLKLISISHYKNNIHIKYIARYIFPKHNMQNALLVVLCIEAHFFS